MVTVPNWLRPRRPAAAGVVILTVLGCVFGLVQTTHAATAGTVNKLIDDGVDDMVISAPSQPELSQPLPLAHAHNDYEHARPLYDALSHGFTSVEADVWLLDGELMVAHSRQEVVPDWTLERLYLAPLEALRTMNGGTVYPGWDGDFQLIIDVKSEAGPTYAAVDVLLREHPQLMTSFTGGRTDHRAVTAVMSGNEDRAAMLAQPTRYAGYDGSLSDADSEVGPSVMPLVSDDWTETFTWDGTGEMPVAEEQTLRDIVTTAHDHGYRVRFWATPDDAGPARDAIWRKLVEVGVDEINTDDLTGLQKFLAG